MRSIIPFPDTEHDDRPQIPAGWYTLAFTHWETRRLFNTAKCFVWFKVYDAGAAFGISLARHYNVKRLRGKPGRKGGFVVGKCSALAREFFTLLEQVDEPVRGIRLDRLPLDRLTRYLVVAKVESVTHDSRRKPIPQALQYSVISELKTMRPL